MASVRMTQALRDEIMRNAVNAYDTANPNPQPSTEFVEKARHAIMNSPEQKFLAEWADAGCKRGLMKEARHGDNILPDTMKEPPTAIDLKLPTDASNRKDYQSVEIKFATPLRSWRTIYNRSYWGNPDVYIPDLDPSDRSDLTRMLTEHCNTRRDHRNAKNSYECQIRDLLRSVTTVKQLLEVWPGAESLIPADAIAKMHVKVTRKQRAQEIKEQVSFDPTIANQAVLTSKMLGG